LRRLTVHSQVQTRTLDRGTYVIRTAQLLGVLAAYLLEPESDDGLAAWNFFDPDLDAGSAYPVLRVLGELPASQLIAVKEIERGEPLTFDHIMRPGRTVDYSSSSASGATWLENSNELIVKRDRQWLIVDPATGASRPSELLKKMETGFAALDAFKSSAAQQRVNPGILSSDAKFGMLSQQSDIYLYDVAADTARQLTHSPKEAEELSELSPTGQHVAYVRDNDIYIVNCQTTEERRLTKDGSKELLNGILDWVYQEEVYGRGQFRAFWFSPDGQRLAFLQLDQSPVLHYQVSDSIHYRQQLEDTRYPKAGDPLPVARMWIADIASGQLREVDLSAFPADDRLVVRVTWSPQNELWLQIQNRIQTEQFVLRVDAASGQATRVLEEKSPGWIEILGQPKFLPDGDFLWLSDLPDGRRHLSRFDVQSGKLARLTNGDWDIGDLLAISPDGQTAFITGNISHPIETQLISVDTQTGETRQITQQPGTHRPRLSHDCGYYIDSWSSLTEPPRTMLCSVDGKVQRALGAPVSDRHRYVKMAAPRLLTIPTRDGQKMQAMVLLPPEVTNAQPSDRPANGLPKRLPVLFHVYGGPQAPTVMNNWQGGNYWWHQYLCSQGYAVVLADNRASRGRGIADTWKIHRDMGRAELDDLEDAVQWVGQQPWADRSRLAVWGWSYGGYFTAYALTHSQLFKAGIAGAPVTDWHNYDAIYTERYMDLPKNNPEGYKRSSAVTAAANLHGRLLLVHGERDDNVHISNTLQLAHALQKAGKPFDLMIYPKNRHGVVEPSQRFHLYQTMTEFLDRNLAPDKIIVNH
jgi:dipeptidyl-peptidase 4